MGATFATEADRRELDVVGDTIRPVLEGTQFEVFEATGPADSGPPPHSHPWDEGYVVLDGKLIVVADDEERLLGPGDSALVPGGVVHLYRIAAPGTRFLTCTSGDKAGAFFTDMDASTPPGPPTDASMPAVIEVAKRNGLSSPLF